MLLVAPCSVLFHLRVAQFAIVLLVQISLLQLLSCHVPFGHCENLKVQKIIKSRKKIRIENRMTLKEAEITQLIEGLDV